MDGLSFSINKGETLSLVGESGCRKSTVGKAILRLFDITGGQVILDVSPDMIRRQIRMTTRKPAS